MAKPQMAMATLPGDCRVLRAEFPESSDFLRAAALLLPAIPPQPGWIWVFSPKALTADIKAMQKDFTDRQNSSSHFCRKKGTNPNKSLCPDAQRYPGTGFQGNEEVKAAQ